MFVFTFLNDAIKGCVHPMDAEAGVLPPFRKKEDKIHFRFLE
jgi:hypothetical protein